MKQDVVMLILVIIFIVILFGTAASIAVRANGMKKVYWLLCSFLLGMGSLSFIYFLAFPVQHKLPDGSLSGEMPPQLGLAGTITQLGVYGTVLGFMVMGLWRLIELFNKRHDS
ncbi:hypothetical protein [Serratia sp. M24T3]|uniref:Uncharacterized protein n=1 Tax=Rouxiella sp. WC2420 TaxID=3234145 RepID=A0AB39VUI8_9GAMM|nr:hypothetical protein [Serratia sp. M24T3]EIC84954.1 hypothetical protein SPM24T3_09424 [Serratia sp. M24T3]